MPPNPTLDMPLEKQLCTSKGGWLYASSSEVIKFYLIKEQNITMTTITNIGTRITKRMTHYVVSINLSFEEVSNQRVIWWRKKEMYYYQRQHPSVYICMAVGVGISLVTKKGEERVINVCWERRRLHPCINQDLSNGKLIIKQQQHTSATTMTSTCLV